MRKFDSSETDRCFGRSLKTILRWLLLLMCGLASSQCALKPIPRDLAIYVNHGIYGVAELEDVALNRYAELTGENYISDQVLREALDGEIIPVYKRFAELVGQIRPQTEPVRKLHVLYRKAAGLRLQGFRTILLALDSKDTVLIRHANGLLGQGQDISTQWQTKLDQLAGQYGLELNE